MSRVLEYLVRAISLGLAWAQHDGCQDDTSLSWSGLLIAINALRCSVAVGRDFLVVLTWAAVIAIAIWPIYIRFAISVLGGRSVRPAGISTRDPALPPQTMTPVKASTIRSR
jgi:hypothetical protein